MPWLDNVESAKTPRRLPVVLTQLEVQALLGRLQGANWLIGNLLYGAGLRLTEALRLRVKDVDFARHEILVRDGKGFKDRVTMLPAALTGPLEEHLAWVRTLHQRDLAQSRGAVQLPYALARKYPNAATEWGWQFVFPSAKLSHDPRDDKHVLRSLRTTMIYTHVLNKGGRGVVSPLDRL